MKVQELKGKTEDQLGELIMGWKKELFNLRFQKATGELENTSRFRVVRRSVARAKTVLAQQAAAGVAAQPAVKKAAAKPAAAKAAKPAAKKAVKKTANKEAK